MKKKIKGKNLGHYSYEAKMLLKYSQTKLDFILLNGNSKEKPRTKLFPPRECIRASSKYKENKT